MASLAALVDAFTGSSLNTSLWNANSGTPVLDTTHQWVQLPCTSAYTALASGTWNAVGSSLQARITPAMYGNGSTETYMKLWGGSNSNQAYMFLSAGVLYARVVTAGTNSTTTLPTYDPTEHAWWCIAESGGNFTFATSPDGYAWTTQATIAHTWDATAVTAQFVCGYYGTESGQAAYVQAVNTTLPGTELMPSWPQVRFGVAFNSNGTLSTQPAYTDLTSRLRGTWSAQMSGRQYELDQIQSGQLTVTLENLDGALDPTNTASPYCPNVVPLKPCRLQAVWPQPNRNLLDQPIANGTAPASSWYPWTGSVAPASSLSPAAPNGLTTATAWTIPAGTTGSAGSGLPLLMGPTNGNADSSAIPVTAGQPYTLSGWESRTTGGDTTLAIAMGIDWYRQDGTQISSVYGGTTTIPAGSWAQMATYTYTAPTGAVWARPLFWLVTSGATSYSNTVYLTGLQFEEGSSATPWTPPGRIYPLWQGYLERVPQQWDFSGTYGLVDVTAVDALAGLAQFTLQPNFAAALTALKPAFMFPFNEPTGSSSYADATGQLPNRFAYASPLGNGGGSITAGNSVQGAGSVGSSGPVITVTNPNWGVNGTSKAGMLIATPGVPGSFPPSSGGFTRIICFRTTSVPTSGNAMCLWSSTGPGVFGSAGSKAWVGIYIDPNQHVYGVIQDATGAYYASVAVADIASCDGNWHIVVVQLSSDGKTWTVANDNHGYQSTTTGSYAPSGLVADTIACEGNPYVNQWQQYFQGDLAFATQINYAIGNTAAYDLGSGFADGWSGESSTARAQRILNMAGTSLQLTAEGTNTTMGAANLAGTDAMSALTTVADSEAGQIWADGSGTLRLDGRLWRYLQNTAAVTFGEQQASGEVPYLGDVAVDFDDTHIYNTVSVTNTVAPGASEQPAATASDSTSQKAYLPRSLSKTINVSDTSIPQYQATYLAQQYAQPLARVAQLTVDGASNPALWSTLLALTFGTRADVKRRPPAGLGAAAISLQQFVEHVQWSGDNQGGFKLGLQLSAAAPFMNWAVVAPLHSTLQAQAAAGASSITLGALTGASLNPAAVVLRKGTKLTVGYGTTAAETVTVQSVAATTPGYTSVAVTLTAALTATHPAGAIVCEPLPSGYTLPAQTAAGYPSSLDAGATLSSTSPRIAY